MRFLFYSFFSPEFRFAASRTFQNFEPTPLNFESQAIIPKSTKKS